MKTRTQTLSFFIGLCIIFIIYLFGFAQGILISKQSAVTALEKNGFTNIRIIKKQWHFLKMRGASDGDDVRFVAKATNPIGKEVTMYVYAGWPWKAATIKTP